MAASGTGSGYQQCLRCALRATMWAGRNTGKLTDSRAESTSISKVSCVIYGEGMDAALMWLGHT